MKKNIKKKMLHKQNGFALMDVFLAVMLLITVSAGIYGLLNVYKKRAAVQTLESDLIRIAQAYAPILNQQAAEALNPVMRPGGFNITTSFLKAIPIPDERISKGEDTDGSGVLGSVLLTNLRIGSSTWADVGFESLSTTPSSTAPAVTYLLMGMYLTCGDATQLIQDLNNTFSLFLGEYGAAISSANLVTGVPDCAKYGGKDGVVTLYFATPALSDPKKLNGSFTAPSAGAK